MGTTGKPKQETQPKVVGEHQEPLTEEEVEESLDVLEKQYTWPVQAHVSTDFLKIFDAIRLFLGISRAEGIRLALIQFCESKAKSIKQLKRIKAEIEES